MNPSNRTLKIATTSRRTRPSFQSLVLVSLFGAASVASAATLCVNPGGTAGCKATISAAVAAAAAGDTIQVWPGTYREEVVIPKALPIVSLDPTARVKPTINAAGQSNGIFINGMSAAPGQGVGRV